MKSELRALFFIAAFALLPVVGWFVALCLMSLTTLLYGSWVGLIAAVIAVLAQPLAQQLLQLGTGQGYFIPTLFDVWSGLFSYVPLYLMSVLLNCGFSVGRVVQVTWFVAMGLAAGSALIGWLPNSENLLKLVNCVVGCQAQQASLQANVMIPADFMVGVITASEGIILAWPAALFILFVGLMFMAQAKHKHIKELPEREGFADICLPPALLAVGAAFIVAFAVVGEQHEWLTVLTYLAVACFTLAGLSALHAVIRLRAYSIWFLVPVYLFLLMGAKVVIAILCVIAVLDGFLDLRSRLKPGVLS